MKSTVVKDKHFKLDELKIKKAKEILKARSETEAVEKALELVITTHAAVVEKNEVFQRIITRRARMADIRGDVADWVREGREERNSMYGG